VKVKYLVYANDEAGRHSKVDSFLPSSSVFEYEAIVVEQFALEADLVCAHTGGEGEAEIGAGDPPRQQPELD
jgi:hypothetical protein